MQIELTLFPHSDLRDNRSFEFEQYEVVLSAPVKKGAGFAAEQTRKLAGKIWRRDFFVDGQRASPFEIYSNYLSALKQMNFDILYTCEREACGTSSGGWSRPLDNLLATNVLPDSQFYVAAYLAEPATYVILFVKGQPGGIGVQYMLDIVEPKAMQTGRVSVSVDDMLAALEQRGKVAIYDIYFDTGKATLKSESDAVLERIRELLARRPQLSLYVVGHTDDTGSLQLNAGLSERRAGAVVDALIARGIAAARLTPFGAGPYAPASTNRDEAGRAKNRRVELVERLQTK